jgi:solute carrier family 50 (sugar transporter)
MEALSEALQPYKDLVATSASVITIVQLLTPILLLNDIRKAKSSAGFSIVPFLGGGVLCVSVESS